jgi:hypothetical protein
LRDGHIEQGYREWWAAHSPEERQQWLAQNGAVNRDAMVEPVADMDGMLIGMEKSDNPLGKGLVLLPAYVLGWNVNDDNPANITEES